MPYAQVSIPGDGVTTLVPVEFALGAISPAMVSCYVTGELDGGGNQLYRTFTFTTSTLAQVDGAPAPIGENYIFDRVVPKDELLVDWTDGDPITAENLDKMQKHALHMTHEALDLGNRAVKAPLGMEGQIMEPIPDGSVPIAVDGKLVPGPDISLIEDAASNAVAAAASAAAAAVSESNAASSASSANTSATSATASASAANTSATNAASSASSASTSATNAGNSATAAAGSASAANTSATNAANSASAANTSATNAANSATAANTAKVAAELAETNAEIAQAAAEAAAASASSKVSKSGDTMTGILTITERTDSTATGAFFRGGKSRVATGPLTGDTIVDLSAQSIDPANANSIRTRAVIKAIATENHVHASNTGGYKVQIKFVPRGTASDVIASEHDDNGFVAKVRGSNLEHIAVNPRMWGAIGNGSTNDTAVFTLMETFFTGRQVDLGGLTYLVTTVPTGNDYVNGFFKVGTAVRSINYHKKRDVLWATDPAFGAGTGTGSDDSAALQALFDACETDGIKNAYIPPTKAGYNLGSEVSTNTNGGGLAIYSDVAGSFTAGAGGGAKINVGFNGIGFDIAGTLTKVRGLRFYSDRATYPAVKALRFTKTTNTDDMDALVEDCEFENLYVGIDHNGRGLYARRNIFALSDHGIAFNWPASGTTGSALHLPPYGMRKWMITDNHFHAMGIALKNFGAEAMRGAVINGNLMDIGRKFWEGPIHTSAITANVLENLSTIGIEITGAGGRLMNITGNHIGGMEEPGSDPTNEVHQPTQGVFFNVSGSTLGARVSGNTFDWIKKDAIRFHRAINYCNISDNIFMNVNTDADAAVSAITVVNTSGLANALTQCVIQGNTGNTVPTSNDFLRVLSGATIASIIDNIYKARVNWS